MAITRSCTAIDGTQTFTGGSIPSRVVPEWIAVPEMAEFLPLVEVAGRRTLPANEVVGLYDAWRNTEDQVLDFVLFYDARESLGVAILEHDEEVFAKTWERVKWDRLQE